MSEAPEAMTDDAPSSEAEFEAARVAQDADDAPEEVVEASEEDDEPAEKAVDWQKRAMDKEGQAAKERARRREAERRARELEDRLQRLEQRETPKTENDLLSIIAELRDDDEDPITDLAQVKRALKAFRDAQSQESEQETRAAQERAQITRIATLMNEAEADFAEDHPDYSEAVEHFKKARREEFEDMGYSGDQLAQAMQRDFLELTARAIQGGRDPAEVVYNLAKKRGFKAGKAQAEENLRKISAAAAAGRTPTGGRNGDGRITPDQLNKLKGAAYDAAWKKYAEQERRAR